MPDRTIPPRKCWVRALGQWIYTIDCPHCNGNPPPRPIIKSILT